MADHSDNKGLKGEKKAYTQANTTINIFNWRLALKEEITAFIKQ